MNYDRYNEMSISTDSHEFKFISVGPNGNLNKVVHYTPFELDEDICNLALGTLLNDGNIDYETLSKNGDRNKILATIVSTATIFSEAFPNKKIFLTGNTPGKTRLYQIAINNAYEELTKRFTIQAYRAVIENGLVVGLKLEKLVKGTNYEAFLFTTRN